ncbi:hypothetical protein PInf_017687 [Phytophthora infestans]|nr:hypothetical protein PInf_017687 [Phytophthora infestans]
MALISKTCRNRGIEQRLTQEDVVTNDYMGSIHGGSALGSARDGPFAPDPPSSSPNTTLDQLSSELKEAQESVEKLSAGRDTRSKNSQVKLTDTELQCDKAATEWADATWAQTGLELKIRSMNFGSAAGSSHFRSQSARATGSGARPESIRARYRAPAVDFGGSCNLRSTPGSSWIAPGCYHCNLTAVPRWGGSIDSETTPQRIHRFWRWISPAPQKTRILSPVDAGDVNDGGGVGGLGGATDGGSGQSGTKSKVARQPGSSKVGTTTASSTKAESVAFVPSKSGSASKTGSAAKTSSKTGPPTGSVATAPSTAGPVASTAVFVSTQSGFTAGSTAAVSTIPRPALSRSQLMGAGSGKAKVKRHIPTGCGLGSSEDDEEDDG